MFFVADGTGGHIFAETYEQHLKNVARLRGIEQDDKNPAAAPTAEITPGTRGAAPAAVPLPKRAGAKK